MLSGRKNTNTQGNIGLADAIAYFVKHEYVVSIPLNDTQPYDLVIDKDGKLERVSVKTSTSKAGGKSYKVKLSTSSWGRNHKPLDKTKIDKLFVLTESEDRYVIPVSDLTGETEITLGKKYDNYIVR